MLLYMQSDCKFKALKQNEMLIAMLSQYRYPALFSEWLVIFRISSISRIQILQL